MSDEARERVRALARTAQARGDCTGWFDELYRTAGRDPSTIPWADQVPNPALVEWLDRERLRPRRAVVIGCGLGDDAEELARRGFAVTAFDVAPAAITWCRERFPASAVGYHVSDLFTPPREWKGAFDLVFESYTLQALPATVRAEAMARVADLVAPGGTLLILCRAREEGEALAELPWPLTLGELRGFAGLGLTEVEVERYREPQQPQTPRFRARFVRAA